MVVVSIGFYSKENYELLLACADDRSAIDDKWEDWLVNFIKAKTGLLKDFAVQEVLIDVKKMNACFKSKKIRNTSASRAEYISEQGMLIHNKMINN